MKIIFNNFYFAVIKNEISRLKLLSTYNVFVNPNFSTNLLKDTTYF